MDVSWTTHETVVLTTCEIRQTSVITDMAYFTVLFT